MAATQLKRKALSSNGKFARARSAWYETCQEHQCLLLTSCVLLPLYSNMLLRACTVVADHLRFHFVGMRLPVEACLVAFMHMCFFQSSARFRGKHVTQNSLRTTHLLKRAGLKRRQHRRSRIYGLWILVCVPGSVQAQNESSTE
eukprot:4413088-Amphidinium_carterae.1